jgi:hypothetical protein
MGYHAPKTKIVCKSYDPGKLMYQLTPTGPTWILALHLLLLVFWMSMVLKFMFDVKIPLDPHSNHLPVNECNHHISSQR